MKKQFFNPSDNSDLKTINRKAEDLVVDIMEDRDAIIEAYVTGKITFPQMMDELHENAHLICELYEFWDKAVDSVFDKLADEFMNINGLG
jgi:hypothetical protein